MSETFKSNPESDRHFDEWKSWPPESFLADLLHELRTPLNLIKGYAVMLSNKDAQEHHPKALEGISVVVERIEELYERIAEYRAGLKGKS